MSGEDLKPWEKALPDYKAKMKYKDIAAKHGVSENTVKSWATRYWKKKKGAPKNPKKLQPEQKRKLQPRKAGAPPGNRNAVGNKGGAPLGNKNNLKHGLYSKVYLDALDEDEQALLDMMGNDEEEMLLQQIELFTIRERRLLLSIKRYREKEAGLSVVQVTRSETKKEVPKDLPPGHICVDKEALRGVHKMHEYDMNTSTIANISIIHKLEAELTRVQDKKTRAIAKLADIRQAKREAGDTGKSLLADQIQAAWELRKRQVDEDA